MGLGPCGLGDWSTEAPLDKTVEIESGSRRQYVAAERSAQDMADRALFDSGPQTRDVAFGSPSQPGAAGLPLCGEGIPPSNRGQDALATVAGLQAEVHTSTSVPLSRIQRLIGTRMLTSKQTKPCFYLATRADVTDLMAMRHGLSKTLGVKVTSNAFFIRALALAATQYPLMVGRLVPATAGYGRASVGPQTQSIAFGIPVPARHRLPRCARNDMMSCEDARPTAGQAQEGDDSWPTEVIRIAEDVNVGFAVNSAQGLVVPVVKQAQIKTLAEIAGQEKVLTNKARINKLTLDDLEGESIALSNLGAFDIDSFRGIVPPPVSTILTAGNVALAPVPRNGHVIVRKTVSLSLAADHRVVDSEYAARFLQSVTQKLEDPGRLV
jgi:pyruvate/2-oxoglutarate dehydrogenase complex dihydrolipoamide acyltransferase (E2) component